MFKNIKIDASGLNQFKVIGGISLIIVFTIIVYCITVRPEYGLITIPGFMVSIVVFCIGLSSRKPLFAMSQELIFKVGKESPTKEQIEQNLRFYKKGKRILKGMIASSVILFAIFWFYPPTRQDHLHPILIYTYMANIIIISAGLIWYGYALLEKIPDLEMFNPVPKKNYSRLIRMAEKFPKVKKYIDGTAKSDRELIQAEYEMILEYARSYKGQKAYEQFYSGKEGN